MKLTSEQVKKIAKHAYPDYKGRKFHQEERSTVDTNDDANWDGGTRRYYTFVRLDNGAVMEDPNGQLAPWRRDVTGDTAIAKLVPGVACVVHAFFCGHDCGCTVYTCPNAPAAGIRVLKAPAELASNTMYQGADFERRYDVGELTAEEIASA